MTCLLCLALPASPPLALWHLVSVFLHTSQLSILHCYHHHQDTLLGAGNGPPCHLHFIHKHIYIIPSRRQQDLHHPHATCIVMWGHHIGGWAGWEAGTGNTKGGARVRRARATTTTTTTATAMATATATATTTTTTNATTDTATLLYPTLLYSTLPYSTLLYSTPPYPILFYSTLLYSTLLCSTLVYSTELKAQIILSHSPSRNNGGGVLSWECLFRASKHA